MPELPEVEVLKRSLAPRLLGKRIVRPEVHCTALRQPVDRRTLGRLTRGRQVTALRRRAKYLLIDLEGNATLVVHLGMSGSLTLVPATAPRMAHEHLVFHLDEGVRLRFVDPRRFGLVFARPTAALDADARFVHLGVEPLDGAFDGALLKTAAHRRRGPVKTFLMDAKVVVGVGNIYASEALWRARVHPGRSVARIASATWGRISEAVRTVLAQAILEGGTTLNDFADGAGNAGYFQVSLAVYGREGGPCQACGQPIRRLVQAGRSTFYCPRCQH